MSRNSEVPNLNLQQSENAVSQNTGGETGNKLKRNYCYVCEVQCTAVKNFLDHQKGKKHLKKLSQVEETNTKKKIIQTKREKHIEKLKKNSNINSHRLNNSLKTYEQTSEGSELPKASDCNSNVNAGNKAMNNFTKQASKYKKNQHLNSDYHNNHSRYQNSRYSYSNYYNGGQEYFYNEQTYTPSTWNRYQNAPPVRNNYEYTQDDQYYSGPRYNAPYKNDYFSANRNASFNSQHYTDEEHFPPFASGKSENYMCDTSTEEITETRPLESCSGVSKNVNKSRNKSNSLSASETGHLGQSSTDINEPQTTNSVNDLNQSSTSYGENDNVKSSASLFKTSYSSNLKASEKKKLRTRSLSSTESLNSDKRLKDKNENLPVDLDGASEEQKLKEYTTSFLETNPNKISRMIQHPSNYKEKAVLNHIVTSFSKTKRKENLTRKLRSNSLGSAGNDEVTLETESVDNDEISVILCSEIPPAVKSTDSDLNKCSSTIRKSKNNSKEINLDPMLNLEDSSNERSTEIVPGKKNSKKSSKSISKSKGRQATVLKSKVSAKRKEKSFECISQEKSVKRKSLDHDSNNKNKKQRLDVGNFEVPCMNSVTEQSALNKDTAASESVFSHSPIIQDPASQSEVTTVKEEVSGCTVINQNVCPATEISGAAEDQVLDMDSLISVETLIELFASGNVAVKREFNDPAIEALKGVDPNELINACSNDPHLSNVAQTTSVTPQSNVRSSKSPISEPNFSAQENSNCINPVILGSTVDNDNIIPFSTVQRKDSLVQNVPSTEKSTTQRTSTPSPMLETAEKDSLTETEKLNLISRTKSEFPHLSKLIEKLQDIASLEETVKQNVLEAKSKINEYSGLLEEWKNKKKKLHDEEEELRKQRNDIIQLMQDAVKDSKDTNSEKAKDTLPPEVYSTPEKNKIELNVDKAQGNESPDDSSSSSTSSSSPEILVEKKKKASSIDSDEILILPSPVKPKPPEIVIDDMEDNTTENEDGDKSSRTRGIAPGITNRGSSLFYKKNLTAHSTVINCIVVFEDFIYTCSNDSTAKRFSLKDTSQSITYIHTAKNVTEVAVEKVQNEALVFTSCSNRVLSLFIASNGRKIKTFFQSSAIMSICKGWGKFYAGLGDGTVNVYNWKYEETEIVKTQNPATRIATSYQGRLRVLIILTSDGNVSLRDAETSLLIRCIKAYVKIPSWLTVHNEFAFLTNSDRSLCVVDLLSGKIEKKIYINSHATGLAVYDDHIFNISYSGVINCINKDKLSDKRLFYGAGKSGLTCIHIFHDWIFTGNRKGDISVFQFDPFSRLPCKFNNCSYVYGMKEDLQYHVEKDHFSKKKNLPRCCWGICNYIFPASFNMKDKMNHTIKHMVPVTSDS